MRQLELSRLIVLFLFVTIWSDCSLTATAGPLHDAAQKGDIEEARSLIDTAVDINAADENSLTALH